MKAFALLLLASLALATVTDGATPGASRVAVEMTDAGAAGVPGSTEAHEAVVPAPVQVRAHVPVAFVERASLSASWSSATDVPPPEA